MRGWVKRLFVFAAGGFLLFSGVAAHAAGFPERSVQIIVGVPPGGTSDFLSRIVAQKLNERWHQPVVVVNRPGADFRIAADYVAGSKPDGYTILMEPLDLTMPNPPGVKVSYDIIKSFTPVALMGTSAYCYFTRTAFPANSLKDIIAMAKTQPLNFAVVGDGGPAELSWKRVMALANIKTAFLHYLGTGPAVTAMLGGEAQVSDLPCSSMVPHLQNNEVKIFAITQKAELPPFSSVPMVGAAAGLPNYDENANSWFNWYGLTVSSGTPKDIVSKMRTDIIASLREPDVKEKLSKQGVTSAADVSQEEFDKLIKTELVRWDAWSKDKDVPK